MQQYLQNKKGLVQGIFNQVFDKYDLMNDFMSLGVHRLWKRNLINMMNPSKNQNLIDVADQRFEGGLQFFKYRALNPIFVSDEFSIKTSDTGEFWITDKSGVLSMSAVAS